MTLEPGEYVAVSATTEPVAIFSGEHRAWWGPNRCGYYTDPAKIGRYTLAEAIAATHHVGPEKLISIENAPAISALDDRSRLLSTLADAREALNWCIVNDGECLGDHAAVLTGIKAIRTRIDAALKEAKDA